MTTSQPRKDLLVLVADKDMELTLDGLLPRHQSLGIRPIDYVIYRHPERDSGCRTQGVTFLRDFCNQFDHAMLIFDFEGSGGERQLPEQLESELEAELQKNGWDERASVLVITPELESWVWSDSTEVDQVAGWAGRIPSLREWLVEEEFLESRASKPERPKEAFRHALRHVRKQPSSSLFKKLSERVSFRRCQDRAFLKLKQVLQEWYPESE
jgi:hypothetical protein